MRKWLKDNSNTLAQMIILASILFVFLGPLGAGFGAAIGLVIGTNLDKNKNKLLLLCRENLLCIEKNP
jgi:transketolase N-terminal domain/subunit